MFAFTMISQSSRTLDLSGLNILIYFPGTQGKLALGQGEPHGTEQLVLSTCQGTKLSSAGIQPLSPTVQTHKTHIQQFLAEASPKPV